VCVCVCVCVCVWGGDARYYIKKNIFEIFQTFKIVNAFKTKYSRLLKFF